MRVGGRGKGGVDAREGGGAQAAMRSSPRKHLSARCNEQLGGWRGLLPLVAETCGRSHEGKRH